MLGSPGSHGLAGTRPAISQKPPLTARDAARGGFEGTAANLYCLANFKRKAFSPQILNRSCLQIRCTVTGGAYHSARRVTMCVRNNYKNWYLPELYPQNAPNASKRPFSPPSFPARRKRRGRRRHNHPSNMQKISLPEGEIFLYSYYIKESSPSPLENCPQLCYD